MAWASYVTLRYRPYEVTIPLGWASEGDRAPQFRQRILLFLTCHLTVSHGSGQSRVMKLRVPRLPGMPATFSHQKPLVSQHASRHMRVARAVMHVGIGGGGKRSRHSRRMRNFAYLVRGLWHGTHLCACAKPHFPRWQRPGNLSEIVFIWLRLPMFT